VITSGEESGSFGIVEAHEAYAAKEEDNVLLA
jgi:hypothetical protein